MNAGDNPDADHRLPAGRCGAMDLDRPVLLMSNQQHGRDNDPTWANLWSHLTGWRRDLHLRHRKRRLLDGTRRASRRSSSSRSTGYATARGEVTLRNFGLFVSPGNLRIVEVGRCDTRFVDRTDGVRIGEEKRFR